MINTQLDEADLIGSEICFLLEVEYLGKPYRFSTFVIDVEDPQNSTVVRYNGGFTNFDFEETLDIQNTSQLGTTLSMELIFDEIDFMADWLQGRLIDHSPVTLSMITVRNGRALQTELNKIHLFAGRVLDPLFGQPKRPKGYVNFTVANNLETSKVVLMDSTFEIDVVKFPNLEGLVEYPKGAYAPWVFGKPGVWPSRSATDQGVVFRNTAGVSPAYIVDSSGSGSATTITFLIAGHTIKSGTARIFDQTGGNFSNNVLLKKDGDEKIYSGVEYRLGHVISDNSFTPALDNDQTFWVSWGEDAGGFKDFRGEVLEAGGDICLYVLNRIGLEVDRASFVGLLPILNSYKFAGYVNDPQVLALDWLVKNIIEYLPIYLSQGPRGLRANLNMYHYTQTIHTQYTIYTSGEFQQITGLQPLDIPKVNRLRLKFCYEGEFDRYLATVGVGLPKPKDVQQATVFPNITITTRPETVMVINSQEADTSADRFGTQDEVISVPFVWDFDTAIKIAQDRVRERALGTTAIEFEAVGRYGYLLVGDIIALNSQELGLVNHKSQVIQKSWSNGKWRFVIQLETNTIINQRTM
jgi:hypothetical protein